MKIRSATIQGFRGFNEPREIAFHDRLTLIYAPNSYGKTSISEAFEWLLYGVTSKVQKADSKEEYKGSYRNRHLSDSLNPSVRVTFVDGNAAETVFQAILAQDEVVQKTINGQEVETWPLPDISKAARPFILQHALKYLLLARPDERFQGFAHLLGLERLRQFQQDVISLCTAPNHCIPEKAIPLPSLITTLQSQLAAQPSLAAVAKAFKKGLPGLSETYQEVASACRTRVPPDTSEESFLPQLLKIREDAVAKIFKGRVELADYSEEEKRINAADEEFFATSAAEPFPTQYKELLALSTVQHVLDRAQFFELGLKLLRDDSALCPFCGHSIEDTLSKHIYNKHADLVQEKNRTELLQNQRTTIIRVLEGMKSRLDQHHSRHTNKTAQLLALEPDLGKLRAILLPKHTTHFNAIQTAMSEIAAATRAVQASYAKILDAIDKLKTSVDDSKEDLSLVSDLTTALGVYVSDIKSYAQEISRNVPPLLEADQVLRHELDQIAGTQDITLLIDLLEKRQNVQKGFEIQSIRDGLKNFRKSVEQYVANRVLKVISDELTGEVMVWYGQIKTTGDPDVHFAGFDMERTKTGDLKSRRVQIKAKSYGRDLASAVSCLSESKLNALGLCVSIATNLKGNSPFDFLIIDDPIQSWDVEHETQFVEVLRKLVERGKQVILLSHNRNWLDKVRSGCRTLNGWFYEITGYTEAGPQISEAAWEEWRQRLKEVDAIQKDPGANSVKLQQAEEEIRIVVAELAAEYYFNITGIRKSAHDLNSAKVRALLVECGVASNLTDRITQTFETTDDAHHAPANYAADRERIRRYHAWAHELAQLVERK